MLVIRVETPDIEFSKFVAQQYVPLMSQLCGDELVDKLEVVAMPSRVENGIGIAEIYSKSNQNKGLLIKVEPFDIENSSYDLLLHEKDMFL